ncbi:MAG TPA: anhydro-N-acetylmuramic acid kinase [Gemmatimonadales bacterium]|nr:anhydro-N-acetylmuramic acid kinase [Gemmatimonadales bacterium]
MTERAWLGVGLMSGTSLDGMDAALVRFQGPTHAELVGFAHRPYHPEERRELEEAIERREGGARRLAHLHARLAEWAADAVDEVLGRSGRSAAALDFIAFHGQTVWHEPPLVTLQLGEPALLAERFGVRIVSGFRGRDLAAGGEGAPLVPIADVLLFGAEAHPRILLNLGGMANLTFVPLRAVEEGAFAFDTGPGMAVIDAAARLLDPTLPYDVDGALAARGRVQEAVLTELLADPYFAQPPPKSTGREKFGSGFTGGLLRRAPGADGVATAVELTARSIAEAVQRWTPAGVEVVASGGGCRHPLLWERLGALLGAAGRSLLRFDELFFSGDAKEAVAFALLGYLTLHGQPGNLPAATGAVGRRVLGVITPT